MQIDDSLYSRQRYVYGDRAMQSMSKSRVFLSGLGPLGVEIAKNVVLGGVQRLTCHDTESASAADAAHFALSFPSDLGRNRAVACAPRLAELNPYVTVDSDTRPLSPADDLSFVQHYSLVVLVDAPFRIVAALNDACRRFGTKFIAAGVRGVFAWSFVDLGDRHEVFDADGETYAEVRVDSVTWLPENTVPGKTVCEVHTLQSEQHDLQEGDSITFAQLSMTLRVESVLRADRFRASCAANSTQVSVPTGSAFVRVKETREMRFDSFAASLQRPRVLGADFEKAGSSPSLFAGFRAVDEYVAQHSRAPRPWNLDDAREVVELSRKLVPAAVQDSLFGVLENSALDEKLVQSMACCASGVFHPLCAFLGGTVAQEVQKAVSGKFTPQDQWLFVDSREVLASQSPQFDPSKFVLESSPRDLLRICVGGDVVDALAKTSLFMVGVGAIGCELLKNFAMLHVGSDAGAKVVITDPDVIEKSNLNRQFLFRPHDIKQCKATVAARALSIMNPRMKIEALLDKVCPETEDKFSDSFFEPLHILVNALDNVEARRYMDGRAVALGKPLLESGTLGTKGHVQVILPHTTTSYTDNQDPPTRDIPFCTLKSFPNKIEHTIEWAKDLAFQKQFCQKPAELSKILQDASNVVDTLLAHPQGPSFSKTVNRAIRMLQRRPRNFADCVCAARLKFERYFADGPKQLLHLFPPDHMVVDGEKQVRFWTPPKVAPVPLSFDASNAQHLGFVMSFANLYANMWGVPECADPSIVPQALASFVVPSFVAKDKKVETDPTKKAPDPSEAVVNEDRAAFEALCASLRSELQKVPLQSTTVRVAEFEKDDDSNHHIDFITACANLRALNYQIKIADRLEVKRIAGRIVPAIATSTSVVSAHVATELVKCVARAGLDDHRNLNTNLALPFYLFSVPDTVIKKKLNDVTYTKWDTWDVKLGLDVTIDAVISYFFKHYQLRVQSIIYGPGIVYHEDFFADTEAMMRDVLNVPKGAKFVPLTIMFHGEGDAQGTVLAGPAVRYFVKAATKKRRTEKKKKQAASASASSADGDN